MFIHQTDKLSQNKGKFLWDLFIKATLRLLLDLSSLDNSFDSSNSVTKNLLVFINRGNKTHKDVESNLFFSL